MIYVAMCKIRQNGKKTIGIFKTMGMNILLCFEHVLADSMRA
jgi:hypothetical protein